MAHLHNRLVSHVATIALATAVLAGGLPSAAFATTPKAGKVTAPRYGAYVGVCAGESPFDMSALVTYRKQVGENPAIVMWYQPWADGGRNQFDTSACVRVWQRGAIPMITWEPWDPQGDPKYLSNPGTQPEWTLKKINSGKYDAYIHQFAKDAAASGGPVMIRLMHEMNGYWYPWGGRANGNSAAEFRAAWRRVVRIFREEGATNVTWVWAPNEAGKNPKTDPYVAYYPGSSYVDWVGLSGYNWGTSRPKPFSWRTFETIYHGCLRYLYKYKKPIMVAEIASVPNGGNKAYWMAQTFERIRNHHKEIKAVIYYNRNDKGLIGIQKWKLDSSRGSLSAYRTAVRSKYYKGPVPKTLRNWTARLRADQWTELSAIPRMYY
ncbi:MAG TPA: glycosyl hydrolase [Coriobacteriia bacterium]|nr:glycosyl hydrolase [Coriobacteriia bacterium]